MSAIVSWLVVIRVVSVVVFAAIFLIGAADDRYEPSHEWLMPVSVIGLGVAIGRWWALWLAILPVALALPEGTSGDPPAVPAAVMVAVLGAGLLAVGVAVSKAVGRLSARRANAP